MSENGNGDGWRERISHAGEDAVGRIASELLGNPVVSNAIQGVMEASEKVSQAQDVAMGALNLPKAGDFDKLERRLRSLSERLERVEDVVDVLEEKAIKLDRILERLAKLEENSAETSASGAQLEQ